MILVLDPHSSTDAQLDNETKLVERCDASNKI